MPRAGFESATPATKRPQTYALDRAAGLQRTLAMLNRLVLVRQPVKPEHGAWHSWHRQSNDMDVTGPEGVGEE
jgi:hypothetical protein